MTAAKPQETFAIDKGNIDPALFGLESWLGYDPYRIAVPVPREEALQVPAVLTARQLIAGTIGTLPLETHDKTRAEVDSPFVRQPDPSITRSVLIAYTVEDLMFEGEAWWRITGFDWQGFPARAKRIEPWRVDVAEDEGVVRVDGKIVPDSDLIRFVSPNPPLLKYGARAIRKALQLDITSTMYAENPQAFGYFTPADGADPDVDEVGDFLDEFGVARRTRPYAYVGSALKYNEVHRLSPAELELSDARQHAVLEIARCVGLDPEDLGVSTTSRTYQNAVERRQDRVNNVLAPYMNAITERLSMPDVTPRGRYVVFDLDNFLKADPLTRAQTYEINMRTGVTTLNEARATEDKPNVSAPRPTTASTPTTQEAPAMERESVTFSREELEFATEATDAAFSVDEEARTITGLAVPWGQVTRKNGRKFRFEKDSLVWKDTGRVKMLQDHDNSQAIGKAVSLVSTELGLEVKFRIARGPEGDKALALAADGVKDGLSVGVDYVDDGFEMDGDVISVRKAALREVTLTAMPAYDDARVTSVAASQDGKDVTMSDTPDTTPQAPALPDLGQISQAITDGFARLPQREIVSATGGSVSVTEPKPYRLTRNGDVASNGKFEFSTDVFEGAKGDQAAQARALGFLGEYLGFDVDTTDGAALTPNKQRPDLYVDQRDYRFPLWEAVNRGTLQDNTPFVLPKFNTSSGLVAAHTEGVEPTAGAFTVTSQTITPRAVSGKVEITRELWDRGGNPQISSIIWRQMVKAYMESLEAYVVTVLDAASPTGITLTTNAVDDALADELQTAFVNLQYVRGGFAFDTFAVQIDLYRRLALAEDSTGRPLFPMLGPMNTNGQARKLWGSLDVGGIEAIPSWALAATGSVAASSYLFDRYAVNFWASAPQRLQFEYRVAYVDLAIWGYQAGAITDLTGVREVIYDPTT